MKPWQDMDKDTRKTLSKLAEIALDREESAYLGDLACKFDEWREGKIDSGELNDAIHRYHQGPSRDIYTRSHSLKPDYVVPLAIACGFLEPDEIPEDLRGELVQKAQTIIAAFESGDPPDCPESEDAGT